MVKIVPKIQFTSFENSSLMRKLTILYFFMSILPVGFLYFLYLQVRDQGRVIITEYDFFVTLSGMVVLVGVGYLAMRSIVTGIVDIAKDNRETLIDILGPAKFHDLKSGNINEISILAQSFNEITSPLEDNVRNLELAKKTLHSVLARVGEGISTMENIDTFLNLIVETVTEALDSKSGIMLLLDEKRGDLYVKTAFGQTLKNVTTLRFNPEAFQAVIQAGQATVLDKITKEHSLNMIMSEPALCVPLMLHDEMLGFIAVCGRNSDHPFNEDEKHLLNNLSLQTAVALENSKLNSDAEKTYFETISALALAVEAKDPYSRGHSERVAKTVTKMAKELGLSVEDQTTLRDAAKLHDLGKIGVTDSVLTKAGSLTKEEMDMMKKHCEIGEGIIKPIRSLRSLCDIVRHHHEKLDGSGYPDGLRGDEISPLVRILAVADIYDALTTNRPYRNPFTKEKALEELRNMKDQIDQKIVDVLDKII